MTQGPVHIKNGRIIVGSPVIDVETDAIQDVTRADGSIPSGVRHRDVLPAVRIVRVPRLDNLLIARPRPR